MLSSFSFHFASVVSPIGNSQGASSLSDHDLERVLKAENLQGRLAVLGLVFLDTAGIILQISTYPGQNQVGHYQCIILQFFRVINDAKATEQLTMKTKHFRNSFV